MEGVKQRFLGLCLPPLLFCVLDITVTLVGQSARYWAGEYWDVNEGSPVFHDLLQIHPALFVAGCVAWMILFVGCILLLPDTLALIVSITITFGHTVGATTWLMREHRYWYQLGCGLLLVSATIIGLGIRWGWRARPEGEYVLRRWPAPIRWGLVGLSFGVGVYLCLWPQIPSPNMPVCVEVPESNIEATVSTDSELEQISHERRLKQLCLAGPGISGDGLEQLKGLAQLEDLTLRCIQIPDGGLGHLAGLRKLRSLNLDNVTFSGGELKHLAGLPRLISLRLDGPTITDASLEHISSLTRLRSLQLCGASITDAGLEHLKGLSQLGAVYLHCTNCTSEGRKKLREALPECRIER